MSLIYWNENLKRLFDLQIIISSKDQELYLKLFESENCEKMAYHHYELFSKYFQQDLKKTHKISEIITAMINNEQMMDPENSELYEKKNYVDHNLIEIEQLLGKLFKASENGTNFLNESRKKIVKLEELKLGFDFDCEKISDKLLCQKYDVFFGETLNDLINDCFNKGQEYLKEYSLLINYVSMSGVSIMNASMPLINNVK
jgi:hypothetical protein